MQIAPRRRRSAWPSLHRDVSVTVSVSKREQPTANWDDVEPEVVDTRRAARILGLSPATLATLRSRGGGPPYCKLGRAVRYRVADLRAWRDARLERHTGSRG